MRHYQYYFNYAETNWKNSDNVAVMVAAEMVCTYICSWSQISGAVINIDLMNSPLTEMQN
jgi:hypothetical protein